MIESAATISYDYIPEIVIPISKRQSPLENLQITFPSYTDIITSRYGKFPVHYAKLWKIAEKASLRPNNEESPSDESIIWSYLVIQQFEAIGIPPSQVVASAEGGTAVCFVAGNKYADIESLNSGTLLGVISDKRNRPNVWEVEQSTRGIAQAALRICNFLNAP